MKKLIFYLPIIGVLSMYIPSFMEYVYNDKTLMSPGKYYVYQLVTGSITLIGVLIGVYKYLIP